MSVIQANGTSYEVRVAGNFEGESTEISLVDPITNEVVSCQHDGQAYVVEELQSEAATDETYFETTWKEFIDCKAILGDGIYFVQQGSDLCTDSQLCAVTASAAPFYSARHLRTDQPRLDSVKPNRVSTLGGAQVTLAGVNFGEAGFNLGIEGASDSTGYKVVFINNSGDGDVVDGEIVEHLHNSRTMVVNVPALQNTGNYQTKVYTMVTNADGEKDWLEISRSCGSCNIVAASDTTPMVSEFFPGNAMNPHVEAFWTEWGSLDSTGTSDTEYFRVRYQKHLTEDSLDGFCQVPIAIQARVIADERTPEETDQVIYRYNVNDGFVCRGDDQREGSSSPGQCLDYEVRYLCDNGIRIKGRLLTGAYGDGKDEVKDGVATNRLSGPALIRDEDGYNVGNCDYKWTDDEDNIYKTHATDGTATCNLRSALRYGNYFFGTQTKNNGEGATSSIYTYPGNDNKFYNFNVHNQVSNVSPALGSSAGGNRITVEGPGFDADTYDIFVGGQQCTDATTDTLDSITCTVPADKTCSGWTPGSRGATQNRIYGHWIGPDDNRFMTIGTKARTVMENTYNQENLAGLSDYKVDKIQTTLDGFFVPAATGYYTFTQSSDDYGQLWFTDEPDAFCDTESKLTKRTSTSCCGYWNMNHEKFDYSDRVHLEKGRHYAYQFKHFEGGGGSYFSLGYIYHGEDDFNIEGHGPYGTINLGENQATERHELTLVSHEQRENIAVEATGDAEFRLQWCDLSNNCKMSTPMDPSDSAGTYKSTVQYLLNSQVEYSGSFDHKLKKSGNSKSQLPAFDGEKYTYYKQNWDLLSKDDVGADGIDFEKNPDVCMAVKSGNLGRMRVYYSYLKHPDLNDPEINDEEEAFIIHETKEYDFARTNSGSDWEHFCMDIFTPIRDDLKSRNVVHGLFPTYRFHRLQNIGGSMYFDEVLYGKNNNYAVITRVPGFIPNVWIKGLNSQSKIGNTFNVQMIEKSCGYAIPDFVIPETFPAGAENTTYETSEELIENVDGLIVTGTRYEISYILNGEEKQSVIRVYENKKVSPGVTGDYTLDLGILGKGTFDVEYGTSGFASKFNQYFGYNLKNVAKSGDCNRGFVFKFDVDSSDDIPDPVATNTGLSRPELEPQVKKIRDGGVWFKIISGNQLRQRVDAAEVTAIHKSSQIATTCGGDCSYSYVSDGLPAVDSVSPEEFNGESSILVIGKNFVGAQDLSVTVGGVECSITSVSEINADDGTDQINCDITGLLPGGQLPVIVGDSVNGRSVQNGQILNAASLVGVTPSEISKHGGAVVTLSGQGLVGEMTVEFNGVEATTSSELEDGSRLVIAPSGIVGPVNITLTSAFMEARDESSLSYVESFALNGDIALDVAVAGRQTKSITFTPVGYSDNNFRVLQGDQEAIVTDVSSIGDEITLEFETLPATAGMYIQVQHDDFGLSDTLFLNYWFVVESVTSEWGNSAMSAVGGSDIVITTSDGGLDGAIEEDISVMIGDKDCPVTGFSSNTVSCTVPNFDSEYTVNLSVEDQAWDPASITVYQYEKVTWTWAIQTAFEPAFKIQSLNETTLAPDGIFESAQVTGYSGSVSIVFDVEPGIYTYSSGLIDGVFTEFIGTVEVLPPKEFIVPVKLTVRETRAFLAPSRSAKEKNKNKERMACEETPFTAPIAMKEKSVVVLSEAGYPTFFLSPDWSLEVDQIVDNGDGTFTASIPAIEDDCAANYHVVSQSMNGCSETINFSVDSVSTGQLTFSPSRVEGANSPIGDSQRVVIIQSGRGIARQASDFIVVENPLVTSVQDISVATTNGGVDVIIEGRGLNSENLVSVTSDSCESIQIVSSDQLICTTNTGSDGDVLSFDLSFNLTPCSVTGEERSVEVSTGGAISLSNDLVLEAFMPTYMPDELPAEGVTELGFFCSECHSHNVSMATQSFSAELYLVSADGSEEPINFDSVSVRPGTTSSTIYIQLNNLADYGPGRVRVVIDSNGSVFGLVIDDYFPMLEKTLNLSDDQQTEYTFSTRGGETVTVALDAITGLPVDFSIQLGEIGSDLCTENCGLQFEEGASEFSFVVPDSNGQSSAMLFIQANGGAPVLTALTINYSADSTPNVASISPVQDFYNGGSTLTISGSNFGQVPIGMLRRKKKWKKKPALQNAAAVDSENNRQKSKEPVFHYLEALKSRSAACDYLTVNVGINEAIVQSCTDDEIVVLLPYAGAGVNDLSVQVEDAGLATLDSAFTIAYQFGLSNVEPTSGSLGGGTLLTITGTALTNEVVVTVCGLPCTDFDQQALLNTGTIICKTPVYDVDAMGDGSCTVNAVAPASQRQSKVNRNSFNFSFDANLTPSVTGVDKTKGGTAGGTELTITGTLFTGQDDDQTPEVSIGGNACTVTFFTATQVVCTTEPAGQSVKAEIVVFVPGHGDSEGDVEFWFIDRYSSPYTWGCDNDSCLPQRGDIVVVGEGQTLLLDATTPVLAVLLIDGGTLIWDRVDGIQLKAEYIIVTRNGHFEIGTEEEPFCPYKAEIILFGHHRSIRLPIYGAKVFAARSGTVDIHGCKVITWTQLAETADAGTDTIRLEADIRQDHGWQIGDEIVVATTGKRLTMTQSEHVSIVAISEDGTEITLNRTLLHTHLGVESTWNGHLLEQKAEVGLLTRNIKMRGNVNMEWHEALPECETEFESDENAIQNCFLNKFNDEVGSDKFGSHFLMHKVTHAKVEYMEVTHSGQGFVLGRYSLHFHMSGHQPNSYFRGLGIHHTFNRAMTIHGTHMALFEWNVAYRCEGHNFFIEDGFEEMNTIQYNLGVFARPSSSMLNTDQKATTFWVTNTNNRIRHNHAAGGAFFGFWINPPATHHHANDPMHAHHDMIKCPRTRPVLEFNNNTAHSVGEYGFWIFEEYMPADNDCGSNTGLRAQQVFNNLVAWRCKRGFEIASAGNGVRIHNSIISDNTISNFAFLESRRKLFGNLGYGMTDGVSIGYSGAHPSLNECTSIGLETPWKDGSMDVDGIEFHNFDQNNCKAIDACYNSDALDCGFTSEYQRVKWRNSPNRFRAKWEHVTILYDRDGTLTAPLDGDGNGGFGEGTSGAPGSKVVATSGLYDSNECVDGTSSGWSRGFPASVCSPDIELNRFGLNKAPSATQSRSLNVTNAEGHSRVPFRICRSTHSKGYMAIIPSDEENYVHWYDLGHVNNMTYRADVYDLGPDKTIRLSHEIQKVDYASGLGDEVEGFPQFGDGNLAYSYTNESLMTGVEKSRFTILAEKPTCSVTGSQDAAQPNHYCDTGYNLRIYKCFWQDCIPPPTLPPTLSPTQNDCQWSDETCWENGIPPSGVNVTIQKNVRMIVDVPDIEVDLVFVEGGMVFDPTGDNLNYNFKARQIISNTGAGEDGFEDMVGRSGEGIENNWKSVSASKDGRTYSLMSQSAIIIGSQAEPWPCEGQVNIELTGDKWSKEVGSPEGAVVIGAKAIAALGGLEMHGCPIAMTKTFLKTSVLKGQNQITLVDEPVDWKVGGRIFIASSSFEMRESEEFLITEISGSTLTLDRPTQFPHYGADESDTDYTGWGVTHFAASVGYLTRNIKIDGSADAEDVFGGRIVVMRSKEEAAKIARFGYIQLSNVELTHMGQFGYREEEDRRGAVFIWGLEDANEQYTDLNIKKSWIKDCAFHKLYNTAVGSAATYNLEVSGNVIYNTVDDAVVLIGNTGAKVNNNLIARVVYSNLHKASGCTFCGVQQKEDFVPAGIWLDTQDYEMTGNVVAGSDGSCYKVPGKACDASEQCSGSRQTSVNQATANRAHSCIRGVENMASIGTCGRFDNFIVYKTIDFGFFIMTSALTIVENSLLVNNWVGIQTWNLGSSALSHDRNPRRNTYKNLIIDQFNSGSMECDEYTRRSRAEIVTSGMTPNSRVPFTTTNRGSFGMLTPDYTKKKHKWPVKNILFAETYASLLGGTCVYDTDFLNFGVNCNRGHAAIGTNSKWVDHKHKLELNGCSYSGDADYRYQFARPKLETINLSECVDMDCDGLKRAMVIDVDGKFTGTQVMTPLVAQSEYHYERWVEQEPHYYLGRSNVPNNEDFQFSSPQRGLGDFRIPKSMVTALDGSRIPYSTYADKVGTIRDFNQCEWQPRQNGYQCPGKKMATLLLESYDHDRETRRFAPVAIRENGQKLVDIGNGVIDHSCCFGYSCQLRLAMHYFNVECGKSYEYHAAGTVPKHARFHLLGLDSINDDCQIRVDFYVARQTRQKVYLNDIYQQSNQENGDGTWKQPDDNLKPGISDPAGSNYFQRMEQVVYFNIDAGSYVDIKSANTIVLELDVVTELTVNDFWDDTGLAEKLAVMLGIDESKIKKMNVISESSSRTLEAQKAAIFRRQTKGKKSKKRTDEPAGASNHVFVQFEIAQNWNTESRLNGRNEEQAEIDFIAAIANTIVDKIDDGTIQSDLNQEIATVAMGMPPKEAETPEWYDDETNEAKPGSTIADQVGLDPDDPELTIEEVVEVFEEVTETKIEEVETYQEVQERVEEEVDAQDDMIVYSPIDPVYIGMETDLRIDHSWEDGVPITPPVVIFAYNAEDIKIEAPIKTVLDPWRVAVDIAASSPGMTLDGDLECSFSALGKCTFDNLIINGSGDIKLSFNISYQAGDETVIDDLDTEKLVVVTTTTVAPPTTQATTQATTQGTGGTTQGPTDEPTEEPGTTIDPPTTTEPTTTTKNNKDLDCVIKKKKQLICADRNLVTGRNLAIQIMKLSKKSRGKIKSLDISNNPNFHQSTLQSILGHLPGLTSLKVLFSI